MGSRNSLEGYFWRNKQELADRNSQRPCMFFGAGFCKTPLEFLTNQKSLFVCEKQKNMFLLVFGLRPWNTCPLSGIYFY